jgi:hypothetical protein
MNAGYGRTVRMMNGLAASVREPGHVHVDRGVPGYGTAIDGSRRGLRRLHRLGQSVHDILDLAEVVRVGLHRDDETGA